MAGPSDGRAMQTLNDGSMPTTLAGDGGIGMGDGIEATANGDGAQILAYAKLEFPTFDAYIQKLDVLIGRRPAAAAAGGPNASDRARGGSQNAQLDEDKKVKMEDFVVGFGDDDDESAEPESSVKKEVEPPARPLPPAAAPAIAAPVTNGSLAPSEPGVQPPDASLENLAALALVGGGTPEVPLADIDLGPLRAVSRNHARLVFDMTVGAWVIEVLGRNGVVVGERWRARGEREILSGKRTKLQIAERIFYFVLPTTGETPTSTPQMPEAELPTAMLDLEEDVRPLSPTPTPRKLNVIFPSRTPGEEEGDEAGSSSPSTSTHVAAPASSSRRGRGRPPKISAAAQKARKGKAAKASQASAVAAVAAPAPAPVAPPPAMGKGKGPMVPPSQQAAQQQTNGTHVIAGVPASQVPPAAAAAAVAPKPGPSVAPVPAGPPPPRPPYTYPSLVAQAVNSAETKKLTLIGIMEWVAGKYPWYATDTQSGWQTQIRQSLTLAKGFIKIPRRQDEPGKGAFWAIDPTQMAHFDGLNYRKPVPISAANLGGSASASPGAPPGTPQMNAPLPIVICAIPDSYVPPANPAAAAANTDELTAALLRDPPIVLHEGRLILNPSIFSPITPDQLANLQLLPANQALQILQAYVVQHFKDKLKKAQSESQTATPPPPGPAAVPATAAPQTAATATGPSVSPTITPNPAPVVANPSPTVSAGASASPAPVSPAPPRAALAGSPAPRPLVAGSPAPAAGVPRIAPKVGVPRPAGTPGMARPAGTPGGPRPAQASGSGTPRPAGTPGVARVGAVGPNGTPRPGVARPAGVKPGLVRPAGFKPGTPGAKPVVRPAGTPGAVARPPGMPGVARPGVARPPGTTTFVKRKLEDGTIVTVPVGQAKVAKLVGARDVKAGPSVAMARANLSQSPAPAAVAATQQAAQQGPTLSPAPAPNSAA